MSLPASGVTSRATTWAATCAGRWAPSRSSPRSSISWAAAISTGSCRAGGVHLRFAPNMVFDFAAAYLAAGSALDIHSAEAKDVYKVTGRFRITF